jgi:DNA-binding SARP family transcriptional activator/WD40 repeat protein
MWFGLLGPVAARDGDAVIDVPGGRQRVLLAALLVRAGQVVPAGALAEAVWDGSPPPEAAVTLRSHVSRLRRALGPSAGVRVLTRYPGYLIEASEQEVDLLWFRSLSRDGGAAAQAGRWGRAWELLTEALGLWRGDPLADVPSEVLRRDQLPGLERERLEVAERRVDAGLQLGRHGELVAELQSLVVQEPLRERFHGQLMLALVRSGRQAEALEAYRSAREVLAEVLGTEPGTGLRELHQRILTADPSLAAPGSVVRAADHPAEAVPRELPAPVSGFVGRGVGSRIPPPRKVTAGKPKDRRLPGNRYIAIGAAVLLVLVAGGVVGGILATRSQSAGQGPASGHSPARTGMVTPPSPAITSGVLTLRGTIAGPPDTAEHEIAYSPDGSMLVTYGAGSSSEAIVRNAVTGTVIANLPFGAGVSDVAFSPDSKTVAVAEPGGGVGLWSIASHRFIYNQADPSVATGVAFSPDGNTLAVADGTGVRMLDVATRTWGTTLTVPGGAGGLRTVLFTPNGNILAAADSTTGYVYVWGTSSGALIGSIAPPADDRPGLGTWIGYSTATGLLAIGSSGSDDTFPGVRFWAAQHRKVVSALQYPGVGGVNALAYDPADGSVIAVAGMNGRVFVWEMPAGKKLADPLDPAKAEIADIAFSPNGKTLAVLDVNDRIFLWSVSGTG